jgi:diadenosine tetraphosphate (Ap4A) HIT family hydrolase
MRKEDCIFCKIVAGELPSVKLIEDEKHLVIMDLNPNTEGVSLVITKDHFDSDATDMPDKEYTDLMLYAKKTAKILEKGLNVQRVGIIMEGLGINHTHIKLYPIHGLKEKFEEMWGSEKIYFDKYEGYLSTQLGPESSLEKRQEIADKIKKNAGI